MAGESERIKKQFTEGKVKAAQSSLTGLQTQLGGLSAPSQYSEDDDGNRTQTSEYRKYQQQQSSLQSQIASQQRIIADPTSAISDRERDIVKGTQFGEAVLGPDGLGRIGDSADVKTSLEGLREGAQGFSGKEATARRESSLQQLQGSEQGQNRALQARLAAAGVKGGAAGGQLRNLAVGQAGARANMQRDLFIQGEQAKRSGIQSLFNASTHVGEFDLGQAAKEKNIAIQSGLGFADMGIQERTASRQAASARASADAERAAACHIKGTKIYMIDGSLKKIEDITIGDELQGYGEVLGTGQLIAGADIYEYKGEYMSASHLIKMEGKLVSVKEVGNLTEMPLDTIVYPLVTEKGFYITEGGYTSGDMVTEEEETQWLHDSRYERMTQRGTTTTSKNGLDSGNGKSGMRDVSLEELDFLSAIMESQSSSPVITLQTVSSDKWASQYQSVTEALHFADSQPKNLYLTYWTMLGITVLSFCITLQMMNLGLW